MCIFLDISAEDAAKRGGFGTEKYERQEMQDRVRGLFEMLMQKSEGEEMVRINAGGSVDVVQSEIRKQVKECMERIDTEETPLRVIERW